MTKTTDRIQELEAELSEAKEDIVMLSETVTSFTSGEQFNSLLDDWKKQAAEIERLRGVLKEIADQDYRGNRPIACVKAENALKEQSDDQ